MTKNKKILGVGELVVDYIYEGSQMPGATILVDQSGGGTVWNIISNLSAMGNICSAAGVGGEDDDGRLAKLDLEIMGVNCDNLKLLPHRQTRRIHHIAPADKLIVSDEDHRMGMTCPACGLVPSKGNLAVLTASRLLVNGPEKYDVVFFDSINKAKTSLAEEYRRQGQFLVLDIGRIGNLKYQPALDILEGLRLFDIVVLPSKVLSFLGNKLFGSNKELVEESEIIKILDVNSVLVTRGSRGARFYSWYGDYIDFVDIEAEKPKAPVVDSAGAGDAFTAGFAHSLSMDQLNILRNRQAHAQELQANLSLAAQKAAEVVVKLGARGHLFSVRKENERSRFTPRPQVKVGELQKILKEAVTCPLCGLRLDAKPKPSRKRLEKGVASRNARFLRDRLMSAANYPNMNNFVSILDELFGIGYTIGTGGSFPVAHFAADALTLSSKCFAYPMRPLDFIRRGKVCDFILVFSYSGSTTDCAKAIMHAKQINIPKIVLITGNDKAKLGSLLRDGCDKVLSYAEGARERGFVSIAGTVTPCALMAMSIVNQKNIISWQETLSKMYEEALDVERLSNIVYEQLRGRGFIDVFGGGLSWPAMLDLESKFIESGIGRVTLHEVKDFSHGRFVTTLGDKQQTFSLFTCGVVGEYEKSLVKILESYGVVAHIHSTHGGILGGFELLIKEQILVVGIGKLLGVDISKPTIPRRALELYRWDKELK